MLFRSGERPDFDLRPQDCTAVMKVCIKLRRYAAVDSPAQLVQGVWREPDRGDVHNGDPQPLP